MTPPNSAATTKDAKPTLAPSQPPNSSPPTLPTLIPIESPVGRTQDSAATCSTAIPTPDSSQPTNGPSSQGSLDTLASGAAGAVGSPLEPPSGRNPIHHRSGGLPALRFLAENLTDIEKVRIATANRLRILTRNEPDSDGIERGFGLADTPLAISLAVSVEGMVAAEKAAAKALVAALRDSGYRPWVTGTIGIGERQGGRLLGAIGNPYWHPLYDRPRTVSELWAYAGLHVLPTQRPSADTHFRSGGEAARRKKGEKANWSTEIKTRAYLCAESCMKQRTSPYRGTYEARRAHTATTHPDWSAGHSHNDALRIVSKAILRDLWVYARELHSSVQVAA